MADYGRESTDAYGNPITTHPHGQQQTGTTGAATHVPGSGAGLHGTGTGGATKLGTETGIGHQQQPHRGLRRSGSSSSSSSSEDDGQGGRRKKGLKEKIKEKLPGGNKKNDGEHPHVEEHPSTGTGGYAGQQTDLQQHEKKGVMEKIKEKLPGQQH